MGLLCFDPTRLDRLQRAMSGAEGQLHRLRCDDPAASAGSLAVRRAGAQLAARWIPRVQAVRSSPAWFDYRPAALGAPWLATGDRLAAAVPQSGLLGLDAAQGAAVQTFPIPVWPGRGATRIQWFIDDDEVCLSAVGPDIGCGHGDARDVASGQALGDLGLPARMRVVLDHERGIAVVVAYSTHGGDGDRPAIPIELTVDGPVELPDEFPSQVRTWTTGEGIDGNIVFDYRFLNSLIPGVFGGVAPAINGAIRVRRAADGEVTVDGRLGQYPTVEIIRDTPLPNGYHSALIHVQRQEPGGPLHLFEPGRAFAVTG